MMSTEQLKSTSTSETPKLTNPKSDPRLTTAHIQCISSLSTTIIYRPLRSKAWGPPDGARVDNDTANQIQKGFTSQNRSSRLPSDEPPDDTVNRFP
jgi:hypothetical protein